MKYKVKSISIKHKKVIYLKGKKMYFSKTLDIEKHNFDVKNENEREKYKLLLVVPKNSNSYETQ